MTASRVISTIGLLLVSSLISENSGCGEDSLVLHDHPILIVSINNWPDSIKKILVSVFLNGVESSEGALTISQGEPGFVYDLPRGSCGPVKIQVTEFDGNGYSISNAPIDKAFDCVSNPQPLALTLPLMAFTPPAPPYKWTQVSTDIRNSCATITACHLKGTTQPFSYDNALTPGSDMANYTGIMTYVDKTTPANSMLVVVGKGGYYMGYQHGSNLSTTKATNWTDWITAGALYP